MPMPMLTLVLRPESMLMPMPMLVPMPMAMPCTGSHSNNGTFKTTVPMLVLKPRHLQNDQKVVLKRTKLHIAPEIRTNHETCKTTEGSSYIGLNP